MEWLIVGALAFWVVSRRKNSNDGGGVNYADEQAAAEMLASVAIGNSPVKLTPATYRAKILSFNERAAGFAFDLFHEVGETQQAIFDFGKQNRAKDEYAAIIKERQERQSFLLGTAARLGAEYLNDYAGTIKAVIRNVGNGYAFVNNEIIQFASASTDHPGWLGHLIEYGYRAQAFQEMYLREKGHLSPLERFPDFLEGNDSLKFVNTKKTFFERFCVWPMPFQMHSPETAFTQFRGGGGNHGQTVRQYANALQIFDRSSTNLYPGMDVAKWIYQWATFQNTITIKTGITQGNHERNHLAEPLWRKAPGAATVYGLWANPAPIGDGQVEILNPPGQDIMPRPGQELSEGAKIYIREYELYMMRSRWLLTAAEWWRVLESDSYKEAPEEWIRHCAKWGVGVTNAYRVSQAEKPDVLPRGGIPIDSLLGYTMAFTPAPGTFVDNKGRSLVHEARPPCWMWPEFSTGSMTPNREATNDFSRNVKLRNADWDLEKQRKIEAYCDLAMAAARLVIDLITGRGGEDIADAIIELAEIAAEAAELAGIDTGPLVTILGLARQFSVQKWDFNPAAAIGNVSAAVDKALAAGGEIAEQYREQIFTSWQNLQDVTKNVEDGGWTYCQDLYGQALDVKNRGIEEQKKFLAAANNKMGAL